ncbi:flagellar hook-length control protein FliK [Desulfoluna spongiiphila]|nr:flagellar hook-length control protein FliK [Desulfoluna spongiiphila]
MQTAVQTTSEATSGLQASGRQRGVKGKQPGGFAALLSAFFGKGNQAKAMGPEALGAGATEGASLKGKATSAKKTALPMVEAKARGKKGEASEAEDGKGEEAVADLLAGLAATPSVPAVMKEGTLPAELGAGTPAEHGPEKNAGAPGRPGAKLPPAPGGTDRMTFQAGGTPGAGKSPQPAGEVGVDRFAEMVRGAAEGKKSPRMETPPSSPAAAATKATDGKAATAVAGAAEGLGNAVVRPASRLKSGGAKGTSPAEQIVDDAKAPRAGRKETPAMAAGHGARSRAPQTEEPVADPLRAVKPIAVDRAGAPVVPSASEIVAAASELEPTAATDTPKSGLTRQLALQVGRQIATSLKKNDREVTFQVRPPSLGRIQIRIEKEGEAVSVRIVSEKEKAGEILAAGKHDLRALMADHGIRLDRIEVTSGATMDFMAQNGGSMDDRSGRGRSSPRQDGQGRSGEAEGEVAAQKKREHDGAISVMA